MDLARREPLRPLRPAPDDVRDHLGDAIAALRAASEAFARVDASVEHARRTIERRAAAHLWASMTPPRHADEDDTEEHQLAFDEPAAFDEPDDFVEPDEFVELDELDELDERVEVAGLDAATVRSARRRRRQARRRRRLTSAGALAACALVGIVVASQTFGDDSRNRIVPSANHPTGAPASTIVTTTTVGAPVPVPPIETTTSSAPRGNRSRAPATTAPRPPTVPTTPTTIPLPTTPDPPCIPIPFLDPC